MAANPEVMEVFGGSQLLPRQAEMSVREEAEP
jgi:hypothetical protein